MRAERRAKREVLKKKRKNDYWGGSLKDGDPRKLGSSIDTPHPCSDYCCGNPRKHFHEKTIQEKKSEEEKCFK